MVGTSGWGRVGHMFFIAALATFSVPLTWSFVRILRLCKASNWGGLKVVLPLQALVHVLCFAAALMRFLFIAIDYFDAITARPGVVLQPTLAGRLDLILFSLFYPTMGAVYLTLAQYWQVSLDALNDTAEPGSYMDCRMAPWQRMGIRRLATVLYAMELAHNVMNLVWESLFVDAVFSVWGVMTSGIISVCCLVTARRLHEALFELAPYSSTDEFFQKLLVGPALMVISGAGCLLLALLQIFVYQWFAWPNIIISIMARTAEVAQILLALATIGDVQPPPPTTAASFSGQSPSRELSSFAFAAPMSRDAKRAGDVSR